MGKIIAMENGTKQDTIASKAADLFRRKGFSGSSVREIAEAVGVEPSSLYNHFGSKSEILQLICFRVSEEFSQHMDEVENSEKHPVEQLEELIRFHIRMMDEKFEEVYVANHEWKQLEEPFLSEFKASRKEYENRMEKIVTAGIRNRELRHLNPKVVVFTLLSAVRGLEFWHRQKQELSMAELEKNMVEHLFHGLIPA